MMRKISCAAAVLFAAVLFCGCQKDPAARLRKAAAYADGGEWSKAEKITSRLAQNKEAQLEALLLHALCCEALSQRDLALDAARRAVEKYPGSFAAHYTLGRLYAADPARQGEAMLALQKALALRPDDANTLVLLCNAACALKAPNTAGYLVTLLKKHRAQFYRAPELYYQLALAYLNRGDLNNALAMLRYVAAAGAGNPALLFNTARCYDLNGRRNEARSCYQDFLRRHGKKVPVLAREAQVRLAELR